MAAGLRPDWRSSSTLLDPTTMAVKRGKNRGRRKEEEREAAGKRVRES